MRKVWSKWLLALAVVASSVMAVSSAAAQGNVSLQVFYDELQPYGTWVDHGRYGYVWMPDAGADFVPYGTNGYWVQTGYGNTWVSNYSWGWAPFHYGRWFYDDFYGWLWVPDTVWGPAWVAWRSGGGYYGWAPLMPGLNISVNVGYYNHIPHSYWNFVPYRYVMYRQVYRHCVPRPRVVNVINHTTVIVNNNYYDRGGPSHGGSNGRDRADGRDRENYFTGPSRSEIERHNGARVPTYDVHERTQPGRTEVSRSSVSLYKPAVEQATRTRALPAQFTRDDDQGREAISEMRTRQSVQSGGSSRNTESNREATRTREGAVPGGRSSTAREASATDNNSGRSYDRSTRDAEFNRQNSERRSEELRREQADEQRRSESQRSEQLQRNEELRRLQQERSQPERQSSDVQRSQREQQVQRQQEMQRQQQVDRQQQMQRQQDAQRQQEVQRQQNMQRQQELQRQRDTQRQPAPQRQNENNQRSQRQQEMTQQRSQPQRQQPAQQRQQQRQVETPRPSRESGSFRQNNPSSRQQQIRPSQQSGQQQRRSSGIH